MGATNAGLATYTAARRANCHVQAREVGDARRSIQRPRCRKHLTNSCEPRAAPTDVVVASAATLGAALSSRSVLGELTIDDEREVAPAGRVGVQVQTPLDPAHEHIKLAIDAVHEDHPGV